MSPLTAAEIDILLSKVKALVGARLQRVYTGDHDLVLEFYGRSATEENENKEIGLPTRNRERWLWIDLNLRSPLMAVLEEKPKILPRQKKPIQLFFHAHAVNRFLKSVERIKEWGRVITMQIGEDCRIEVRLYPHGVNVGVFANGKALWWAKPQVLKSASLAEEGESWQKDKNHPDRSEGALVEEWKKSRPDLFLKLARRSSARDTHDMDQKSGVSLYREERQKKMAKLRRASAKIREEIESKKLIPWSEIGEWLKIHQTIEVPKKWSQWVDAKLGLAENIERSFLNAKITQRKLQGTEKRLGQILKELKSLEQNPSETFPSSTKQIVDEKNRAQGEWAEKPQFRTKNNLRLRKLHIGERWTAYLGRSARDNLGLLRQAKPWHLWLHLRDYPSSYCIIQRNKTDTIPHHLIQEAALWLAKETFGTKVQQRKGEKLVLLLVECRHVRPLKGDKLGRVTYQNAQQLSIVLQDPETT